MTKLSIALLTASLVAVAMIPLAAADETKADCEEQQGWIGYTSTRPLTNIVDAILAGDPAVVVCEGEHWDGQDNVRDDATGRNPPCTAVGIDPADPTTGFVGNCMNPDPNDPNADLPGQGANALGLRLSYRILSSGAEVYVAEDIYGVGTAVTYVGVCVGGQGLEGNAACGGFGEAVTGVYIEDNSEQIGLRNGLASLVSSLGITKGFVDEGDCDQATYQQGAESGDRTLCGRDNTAISADILIP